MTSTMRRFLTLLAGGAIAASLTACSPYDAYRPSATARNVVAPALLDTTGVSSAAVCSRSGIANDLAFVTVRFRDNLVGHYRLPADDAGKAETVWVRSKAAIDSDDSLSDYRNGCFGVGLPLKANNTPDYLVNFDGQGGVAVLVSASLAGQAFDEAAKTQLTRAAVAIRQAAADHKTSVRAETWGLQGQAQ